MDLNGTVALVTGGNGGLGQRICHALAKEGVHVAVIYAQSRDQAEGVARELTSRYQINAASFACDITDGTAVERLVGAWLEGRQEGETIQQFFHRHEDAALVAMGAGEVAAAGAE